MSTAVASHTPTVVRTVGAPSSYRPEYCKAVEDYFYTGVNAPPRRVVVGTEPGKNEGEWRDQYRVICAELPDLSGFARSIGVSRDTLYEWMKRHPAFSDSCARARSYSESAVADRANNGLYNAQFAAFYQKNVYGWKDKTEIETVNSQDSQDMGQMKQALANASAEQLAQFSALVTAMQAQVPVVPSLEVE